MLFFSFLEAEETLLIDIATNSKFHKGSGVTKGPVREQPLVLVLPSSLPQALCLSSAQTGIVFPLTLSSGSVRHSVVMTGKV